VDEPVGEPASELCPHCGQGVAFTPIEVARRLTCPHCGNEFLAPAADGSTDLPDADDEESADADLPGEEALTAIRIRQLAAGRRATYRARSYCVVAAAACLVSAAELVWKIIKEPRTDGWKLRAAGYALFALLATFGLVYFLLRARMLHREAKQIALPEPTTPPDFSTLSDGSNRAANLEDVR